MNQFEMKGKVEDDKLVKRLQEAAKVPLTSEERKRAAYFLGHVHYR